MPLRPCLKLLHFLTLLSILSGGAATADGISTADPNAIAPRMSPPMSFDEPIGTANISFSEFPIGTVIADQYVDQGIVFTNSPFISSDSSNPNSPVLSGSPRFMGPISAKFVYIGGKRPRGVDRMSLNAGYFDSSRSVKVTVYDAKGGELGSKVNTGLGIERITFTPDRPIYSWTIRTIGSEPNGFAIDDLSFSSWSGECGDQRDSIRREYYDLEVYDVSNKKKTFVPNCANFTTTRANPFYDYEHLKGGDYKWSLLRDPIIRNDPDGYGLTAWVTYIGKAHQVNSAYRNPTRNKAKQGKPGSRHMFGDAIDLQNETQTQEEYDRLREAAITAMADYIEPTNLPCAFLCVHADWRNKTGGFQ